MFIIIFWTYIIVLLKDIYQTFKAIKVEFDLNTSHKVRGFLYKSFNCVNIYQMCVKTNATLDVYLAEYSYFSRDDIL
jgi:hypothetical protein